MKKKLTLFTAFLALFCLPLHALAEASVLTVTGTAEIIQPADAAVVMLGVRENAADVREAQANVNNKIAAVRAALVEMGIENNDISTSSLYIYANYNYDSGDEKVISYTASNTLKVVVKDIAMTGVVIDTAFGAGANTLDYVDFLATDASAAQDEAYRVAVADAKHKAEIIAEAAGMQLKGIIDISEGAQVENYSPRSTKNMMSEAAAEDAGTDIQAAGVSVSATVTLVYAIEKP